MDKKKNESELDYVNYQNENEDFDQSMDKKSIRKNNRFIIFHIVLIITTFAASFIVVVLNIDIFLPLGIFGGILRYVVAGILIGYLIIFFKNFSS